MATTIWTTEAHCGFGGTNFRIYWDDSNPFGMPGWAQSAQSVTRHVPGGNVNITQLLGLGHLSIAYRLFFETPTEFNAFMDLRQTAGVLTVFAAMCEFNMPAWEVVNFGDTYLNIPDVTLMDVSDVSTQVDGRTDCTALFQLQERPA